MVVPVPDHHHVIAMMAPAMIPMFAIVAMFTKLGARATIVIAVATIVTAIALPDDDGFSTRDRRGRQTDGNNRRDDISKLLHDVLFLR
jgi:UPF0716 family protein affecting phage T7 exclusion